MPVNYKNFVIEMQISLDEIAQQNIFLIFEKKKTPEMIIVMCDYYLYWIPTGEWWHYPRQLRQNRARGLRKLASRGVR